VLISVAIRLIWSPLKSNDVILKWARRRIYVPRGFADVVWTLSLGRIHFSQFL
jgi:hypothetical protein